MSRNPHEATPQLRQNVKSLSAVGLPQEDIATIVGISEKTLRLHYRQELDEGAEEANAAVAGFLMQQIEKGNVAAMIFYEKSHGGPRKTSDTKNKGGVPTAFNRLPCNGVGCCINRYAGYYVPGEELWPAMRL